MKKLWVYADFDWLKEIEPVGELSYESLRGSDSYGFEYSLNHHILRKLLYLVSRRRHFYY